MAVSAAVGLGLAAAGTAAAIKAARTKTNAKKVTYGGSAEGQDALTGQYAQGVDQGNKGVVTGQTSLQAAGSAARDQTAAGYGLMQRADGINAARFGNAGSALLANYQPGQVAAAQGRQMLDANTNAAMGVARTGGALGLRNALNANAGAGQQLAQANAVQAAQERQALLGAQVNQGNIETQGQIDANATAQAQRAQLLGLGTQVVGQGIGNLAGVGTNQGQLGLGNQGQYLGQQQNVLDMQFKGDLDYEARRQADQQRKAQNRFGLAQTFFGMAGKAAGGG